MFFFIFYLFYLFIYLFIYFIFLYTGSEIYSIIYVMKTWSEFLNNNVQK